MKLKANPLVIQQFATRTKCLYCKHKFEQPLILPVKNPERGKLQPNFNAHWLFHAEDTHGFPHELVIEWMMAAIYGKWGDTDFRGSE